MMPTLTCPECGAIDNDIVGHEIRGVYDGVLYWACTACGLAWARDWTGYGSRQQIANQYVAAHNEGRRKDDEQP